MKLDINGKAVDVNVPPDTPLLWVLREEAGLTGTKFGCGRALCGACTVHIDGAPRRSCVTAVGDVVGKPITTIEGLAPANGGQLHPVQQAWIEESVPQCGFCQAGQIMTATALLRKKPEPTDADIDAAMAGNLCRCGTYPRIRLAILRAAKAMREAPPPATPAPAASGAAPPPPAAPAPAKSGEGAK